MRLIFLGLDGILHRAPGTRGSTFAREWTRSLVALLHQHPDVSIVIHCATPEGYPLQALEHFKAALHKRIADVLEHRRTARTIQAYLEEHPLVSDYLVLDERVVTYPPEFEDHFVACDPDLGLSDPIVLEQVWAWLAGTPLLQVQLGSPDIWRQLTAASAALKAPLGLSNVAATVDAHAAPLVKVVCLGLEGSLFSNAVSPFPRPGLRRFLRGVGRLDKRVAVFTTVSEARFRGIAARLVHERAAPDWFPDVEYVHQEGTVKDLAFFSNATPEEVLLVGHMEADVHPQQHQQWIRVAPFEPPYPEHDRELSRVLIELQRRIRGKEDWTETVEAVVTVELPEFELVKLDAPNGDSFTIGEFTDGIDWCQLRVGQRLRLEVIGDHATRVASAVLLPEEPLDNGEPETEPSS